MGLILRQISWLYAIIQRSDLSFVDNCSLLTQRSQILTCTKRAANTTSICFRTLLRLNSRSTFKLESLSSKSLVELETLLITTRQTTHSKGLTLISSSGLWVALKIEDASRSETSTCSEELVVLRLTNFRITTMKTSRPGTLKTTWTRLPSCSSRPPKPSMMSLSAEWSVRLTAPSIWTSQFAPSERGVPWLLPSRFQNQCRSARRWKPDPTSAEAAL